MYVVLVDLGTCLERVYMNMSRKADMQMCSTLVVRVHACEHFELDCDVDCKQDPLDFGDFREIFFRIFFSFIQNCSYEVQGTRLKSP